MASLTMPEMMTKQSGTPVEKGLFVEIEGVD